MSLVGVPSSLSRDTQPAPVDVSRHDPEVLGTGADASGLNQIFNADVFTTPPSRRWVVRLNLQF